jgi:Domain of unknown function (DUF4349)
MHSRIFLMLAIACICFSCNEGNEKNKYSEAAAALTDTTSITGMTGDDVKLVKTAAINFKVKDVEHATRSVSALAQKSGGMIFNQSLESVESDRKEMKLSADSLLVITSTTPRSDITARLPSEKLEEFLYNVADLGYYTATSRLSIDDKSLAFLSNTLKQKNRKEIITTPGIKTTTGSRSQTLEIKDEIVDRYIENREIDADVNFSVVNLSLFQNPVVRKEVIANYTMSDYQLSFGKRLGNALSDGWQYFLSLVVVLANIWVFILAALLGYFTFRYFQKRRSQSLQRA